jgi:hypothetical protein
MTTVEATRYTAALERLAEANAEALALAEVLDYFAAVLRGARPDPDGPPLEALPSGSRVRRLLERRAEAADLVEAEWRRLPAEAQEQAASPAEVQAILRPAGWFNGGKSAPPLVARRGFLAPDRAQGQPAFIALTS